MQTLLQQLKEGFPKLNFEEGEVFSWSPKNTAVIYRKSSFDDDLASWSLLHEVGHALLKHKDYESDFHLLKMEMQAWEKARTLAKDYGHEIDENHIQNCLDTYRDWLYRRSSCPECMSCSLQIDSRIYSCFNCGTSWHVSPSRLCRAYRLKTKRASV